MGAVSKYLSDEEVISNLRCFFDANQRYAINFKYWLNTAKQTKDGAIIRVMDRKFLINTITGNIIREVI